MALVQYGPIVLDARKKIAGVVATKGHAGNFMRKKVSPIQPRSQAQRNVRSGFTSFAKNWQALGATVIAAFNSLAKATPKKDRFGNSVTLTGMQLYMSLSRNIQTVSGTPLTAAPSSLVATSPGTTAVVAVAATPAITVTPTVYPASGESAAIYGAPPLSAGKTFIGKVYKLLLIVPYNVSPVAYVVESATIHHYTTIFGAWTAGKKIAILVKNINTTTGAAGTAAAASAIST
jgi:hypothetical protein